MAIYLMLCVVALATTARAQGPRPEQVDLFGADTGGYAHYRIPGLVVTARGTVLAYCEARKSKQGDWGAIDVMLRRSTDGGKTWDRPRKIVAPPPDAAKNPVALEQGLAKPGEITVNNPVAIADRQGVVHLLYCVEYQRCFYTKSDDEGWTFAEPVEITSSFEAFRPDYDWKVLATGPGHGIELTTGRLIVPIWLSTGTGGHAHRPSAVSVIVSDDRGRTWRRGEIVVAHPTLVNPSESAVVELSDGRVMLNIRHESKPQRRGVAISPDGATRWGPLRLDDQLPDPVCMASLVRGKSPQDGARPFLLFSNPHNPDGRARKNLTVKLSVDDGRTWPVSKTIEPGPGGYSDLAIGPDGSIFCLFERGNAGRGGFQPESLRLARFDLKWLTDGRDASRP